MACDWYLSVEHILVECGDFAEDSKMYAENVQQLFQEIRADFLCEIGLFYRIHLQVLLVDDYM